MFDFCAFLIFQQYTIIICIFLLFNNLGSISFLCDSELPDNTHGFLSLHVVPVVALLGKVRIPKR